MRVIRIVPNFYTDAFEASRDFYSALFDLMVSVDLDDWYLQLMPESNAMLNIGFIKPDQRPPTRHTVSPGTDDILLTIHVDDVDDAYQRARTLGAEIVTELRDEEYGQRHFQVRDPNGVVLNVMSAI